MLTNYIMDCGDYIKVFFNNRKGLFFIVDKEFLHLINDGKGCWTALEPKKGYIYAGRMEVGVDGKRRIQFIHRLVSGAEQTSDHVDHWNWFTLDNRTENLRITDLVTNNQRHAPITKRKLMNRFKKTYGYQVH